MRWLTSTTGVVENPEAPDITKALEKGERVVWLDIEEPTPFDLDLLRRWGDWLGRKDSNL
jgi:hypothetical protein